MRPSEGTESLGAYGGHGPKTIGAICDPAAFTGVLEIPEGVLGPRDGMVVVDLIEPGCNAPQFSSSEIVRQTIFHEKVPWIVLTVTR